MKVNLLTIETLKENPNFKFQNDSFKRWCEEHQGELLTVINVYPDNTLRLKGYSFVISSDYTNYKFKVIKQLRDETGCGMMDCKKALASCNWDYNKAKEELKSWGPSGLIDKWELPKWLFIKSDSQSNNEYLEYERIRDYLEEQK